MRTLPTLLPLVVLTGVALTGVALTFGACKAASKDDTAVAVTDSGDSAAPSQVPVVQSVDRVECTKEQSAGEIWSFTLTMTDPQGVASVNGGVVTALNDQGAELAHYDFPCDDSGACNGSFRAVYDNIGCSLGGEMVLSFVVTDIDGNASAPFAYTTG